MYFLFVIFLILLGNLCSICDNQIGPDPWNYDNDLSQKIKSDYNVPPDLKIKAKQKLAYSSDVGIDEWFFRSTLGILVKGGQVKHNEDNSVDISLQLQLDSEKWAILDKYLASTTPFTEEMYRKSIGLVQNAIIKPSITEKIALAWGEYMHLLLVEYKEYIMWTSTAVASVLVLMWLWKYVSHRHLVKLAFIIVYLYEAFISYKEAEQQEVKRFLDAVESCKWRFWSSTYCEVPQPDLLIFLKYMNPFKIGIRMFTNLITEPMITISEVVKVIIHGITDELWFPFNTIVYVFLIFTFNVLIILILIMIIFNYIFNIPFSLSFLTFGLTVKQRNRNLIPNHQDASRPIENDRISDNTLNKLLDVCSKALDKSQNKQPAQQMLRLTPVNKNNGMKRSLSAGRLSDYQQIVVALEDNVRRRNIRRFDGGGDAF